MLFDDHLVLLFLLSVRSIQNIAFPRVKHSKRTSEKRTSTVRQRFCISVIAALYCRSSRHNGLDESVNSDRDRWQIFLCNWSLEIWNRRAGRIPRTLQYPSVWIITAKQQKIHAAHCCLRYTYALSMIVFFRFARNRVVGLLQLSTDERGAVLIAQDCRYMHALPKCFHQKNIFPIMTRIITAILTNNNKDSTRTHERISVLFLIISF